MTTYTAEQIEAIGGSRWTKNGKDRVYLNDWHALARLEITRYHSGNISSATLDGEPLSNTKARLCAIGKVYWENGQIWFQDVDPYMQPRVMAGIGDAVAQTSAA